VPIPTNKPMVRADQADLIYKTEDAKFDAVVDDIAERTRRPAGARRHDLGREVRAPVADAREARHPARGAQRQAARREAEIVAQAGRLQGRVTVATNMAGRGVDIILGGNPEGLADAELRKPRGSTRETEEGEAALAELARAKYEARVQGRGRQGRELGGLYVLGTERHESRRIDNQLRGRSGRQGDPGESRFYLSLEDELMRLFATGAIDWVMGKALPDDVPIEAKMVTKAIERRRPPSRQRRTPRSARTSSSTTR
jgi:preprotein translocase subunit SecA